MVLDVFLVIFFANTNIFYFNRAATTKQYIFNCMCYGIRYYFLTIENVLNVIVTNDLTDGRQ